MNYTGLSAKIAEYIAEKLKVPELEEKCSKIKEKYEKAQNLEMPQPELDKLESEIEKLNLEINEKKQKQSLNNWIKDSLKSYSTASQLATHPVKFTHQDIKKTHSCNLLLECKELRKIEDNNFICTASLSKPKEELATKNAAGLAIGNLLLIEFNNTSLSDCLKKNDTSPLKPFANTDEEVIGWKQSFEKIIYGEGISTHFLSKQIYFPLINKEYHLLSPLFSSSLCNAMDERIRKARYSEEMKEIRTAKKKGVFSEKTLISFPDLAIQTFGGTKPQNISQLNTERGGKTFLLNCTPPTWNTIKRPPLNTESIFRNEYFGRKVYRDISELKAFLETNLEKNSNLRIRSRRTKAVDSIIDKLFQYAAEIQNLTEFQGWSMTSDCKLSEAEKLWLDPLRSKFDQEFANKREQKNWCSEIARNFSKWFNSQLRYKSKLSMGDAELIEWQKLVEKEMAQLKEDLEDFA